ncbi:MAG: LutC/YkgG family protein [Planctomycetota bacterium]
MSVQENTPARAEAPARLSVPVAGAVSAQDTTAARDAVLKRIRERLASAGSFRESFASATPPPRPEIWPDTHPDRAAMGERFAEELAAVHGEFVRCATVAEAARVTGDFMAKEEWSHAGAANRPLVREVAASLSEEQLCWVDASWEPTRIAELPASLIEADLLLADTGSCVVHCPSVTDRLLCYLTPACIVVAKADRLREHLPAAWPEISAQAADTDARGETVLITGPSRTADIEKILILGVHGPKRLLVVLVDEG